MRKLIIFAVAAILLMTSAIVPAFAEAAAGEMPENAKNLALDCEVTCEIGDVEAFPQDNASLENPAWFTAKNLTDGEINQVPTENIPTDLPICWYGASKKAETDIYVTIELDRLSDVYCVKLYPTNFLLGKNMPSNYTVNLSEDGENWVQIGEEKGLSDAGNIAYIDPFVYNTNMKAMYVMIHVTKASGIADANFHYSGIDEIEVWGVPVPKATAAPTEEPVKTDEPAATEAPTNDTAATAEPAATEDQAGKNEQKTDDGKKFNPVIIVVIVAVVLIAVIAAVLLISKKKKAK